MKIALVVPIYEPTEFVLPFLSKFKEGDFALFLVVDDGSGPSFDEHFASIARLGLFKVLRLRKNKGKGGAMKAALSYIKKNAKDIDAFVTADGDGQHSYEDVLKIRDALCVNPDALVLGCRKRSEMPHSSQVGSWWSTLYFNLMTGVKLEDTQTGLRGVPKRLFSSFMACPGSRYEFEMGFLASVVREEKPIIVPIQTIYLKDNASTHFRVFHDSLRIAYFPLAYLFAGILLCMIDVLLFHYIYLPSFPDTGVGHLLASFCASFVTFFCYEIFTHCLVFFIKPRFKKMVIDFFAFAFFSLASFGIAYGFVCLGLPWWGGFALGDSLLFLVLFVVKNFLPSEWLCAYFLN